MIYKNGFFQLVIKTDGAYIKVFPPRQGGKPLQFEELAEYLNDKKIDYNIKQLHDQVMAAKETVLVPLTKEAVSPESEKMMLIIAIDKMSVTARFIPPSTGGVQMKKEDILNDLAYRGIRYGIKHDVIDRFLKERVYGTDVLLAEGLAPRHGTDANIVYHFQTSRAAKPKQNEDGSVDFHDLNMISGVNKGDLLATLEKEDPGEVGMDVFGAILKPRTVKRMVLKYGKNISISEDGLSLYSEVSGHASLEGDRVFVSDTYTVPANVDNATGDIQYEGNVEIKGNVISGFSVTAAGDVIIEGVVEGAKITAGGQIILKRGIQGMNKGTLNAGSNIIAKFIESCKVRAGGYLSTDAIMHSDITVKGDVIVEGKKGFVTGGNIRSGTMIKVKTAGSTMGTHTTFEVGVDPELMEEFRQIDKDVEEKEKEKLQNMQILSLYKKKLAKGEQLSADKLLQVRMISAAHKKIDEEIATMKVRQAEIEEMIGSFEGGSVKIRGVAYPGVKIVISNAVYFVRTETKFSQFIKDGADVKVAPL